MSDDTMGKPGGAALSGSSGASGGRRTRLPGLPPPSTRPAQWWLSRRSLRVTCPHCGRRRREPVAVLEYLPAYDSTGEWRAEYPGVDSLWGGWLVWWLCTACDSDRFHVASSKRVAAWGSALGGWLDAEAVV